MSVTVAPWRRPRIAHLMPYLRGDSLAAITLAARLGFKWIDQNGLCDAEGVTWVLHWRRYRKQYTWRFTGRLDSRGREVREPVPDSWPALFDDLTSAQARDLRSAKRSGVRPHRAAAHMALAEERGIGLALELKNSTGYLEPRPYELLRTDALRVGIRHMAVMTLQNLAGAYRRLTLAHDHGFPARLLPRGRKPSNWDTEWYPKGIRAWGRWK